MISTSFSQTDSTSLKPDTLIAIGDSVTHFCWRVDDQVTKIAKHIVKSEYSDSMVVVLDSLSSEYQKELNSKQMMIKSLAKALHRYSIRLKANRITTIVMTAIVAVQTVIIIITRS